jgi:triosephosphate isomerase (TIM)
MGARNGTIQSIKDIVHNLSSAKLDSDTEVVISPPSLYLLLTREHLREGLEVAAQNVFDKPNGAFTGEISVQQLKDSNITWAILGHSERRTLLQETDDFVASKTKNALDGGIGVILCCGESLEQREANTTVDVVTKQLDAVNKTIGKNGWGKVVIAYEPIWAIGTGKVASTGMSRSHVPQEGLRHGGPLRRSSSVPMLTLPRTSTRGSRRYSEMAERISIVRGRGCYPDHLWRQCQ